MKNYLVSVLFLTIAPTISLGKIFKPLEYNPAPTEIAEWQSRCEAKPPSSNDCYNYATYMAQNLKKEDESLKYFEKACELNHGLACFGLGGIFIKYKPTRKKGIELLKKACEISTFSNSPKYPTEAACKLAKIVSDHQNLNWIDIFNQYINKK